MMMNIGLNGILINDAAWQGPCITQERMTNSQRRRKNMKKLLSLLFASMVVFSLTMPAFASDTATTPNTPATKTAKAKTTKTHKSTKANSKAAVKTSTPAPAKAN
jgi:type IV secretory pathway VirB6-like protein